MSRPELRWVIAEGDAVTLGAWLERHRPGGAAALCDGRVFIDGKRTSEPETVLEVGHQIEIFAGRAADSELRVLGRVGGLLAVDKPAGMATEPDHAGVSASVVARAAELVGAARSSVHALSRLDVGVSGVVLLALDAEARERIERARAQKKLKRRYVAIAAGAPQPAQGVWKAPIGRGRAGRRVVGGTDAQAAETAYAVVARAGQSSLLALDPVTGRTHQLRVHSASAGAPLHGDQNYGGPRRVVSPEGAVFALRRIALHAAWVELPFGGGLRIESPLPSELVALWQSLSGLGSDWERALADPAPALP